MIKHLYTFNPKKKNRMGSQDYCLELFEDKQIAAGKEPVI